MYRIGFIIVSALAISLGLIVGALNHELVGIDLLWVQLKWPLGLLLLCALVTGIVTGLLLAWLFSVLPLRIRLRKMQRGLAQRSGYPDEAHD